MGKPLLCARGPSLVTGQTARTDPSRQSSNNPKHDFKGGYQKRFDTPCGIGATWPNGPMERFSDFGISMWSIELRRRYAISRSESQSECHVDAARDDSAR